MSAYVDNAEFLKLLIAYRADIKKALEAGEEEPRVPEAIGKICLDIANHMATRWNFSGYSFKDDMVGEALVVCMRKAKNFDPELSTFAFAYFSRLCWRAFTSVITDEEDESYVRAKLFYMYPDDMFEHDEAGESEQSGESLAGEFLPYFNVEEYEKKRQDKKDIAKEKKVKNKTPIVSSISLLMEDEEDV